MVGVDVGDDFGDGDAFGDGESDGVLAYWLVTQPSFPSSYSILNQPDFSSVASSVYSLPGTTCPNSTL